MSAATPLRERLAIGRSAARPRLTGRIASVTGLVVDVEGLDAAVGDLVLLASTTGLDGVPAEVVGIDRGRVRCMPLGLVTGLRAGDRVVGSGGGLTLRVGSVLRYIQSGDAQGYAAVMALALAAGLAWALLRVMP